MRIRFLFFFVVFFVCEEVVSQEKYGELSISAPQELPDSIGIAGQTILVIASEVPELQFESTRQIFKTEQRRDHEWLLVIEPDRQMLTLQAPGYLPLQTEVMFFKAKHTYQLTVSRAKPRPGALWIKTKPDSANLRLNGALLDAKTPHRLDGVPPGRYYVQVTLDGHYSVEKELIVESNRVTDWEVALTQTTVRVQIDFNVYNKKLQDVSVLINNEEKGKAPGAIFLEPGSYKLMLKKKGYRNYEQVIVVEPDSAEIRLVMNLESTKSFFFRSLTGITGDRLKQFAKNAAIVTGVLVGVFIIAYFVISP